VTFIPSNQRIEEQALGRSACLDEKGSGIIIPFEKIKVNILQKIRDEKEENRIKNIIEKQIKNIELNAFLFEKFSDLYHRMQDTLIKIKFSDYLGKDIAFNSIKYDKTKEFAILDDIEEKWGTWLKEKD
jgi:hypothetical protein